MSSETSGEGAAEETNLNRIRARMKQGDNGTVLQTVDPTLRWKETVAGRGPQKDTFYKFCILCMVCQGVAEKLYTSVAVHAPTSMCRAIRNTSIRVLLS